MDAVVSPQPQAVGEPIQISTETRPKSNTKQSYLSQLQGKHSAANSSKLELCPVTFEHGEPTVEFTIEEVNAFTIEEGLHQAVILKFSYGKPDLQELRQLIPKQFDVKGYCNIGQLEYRHVLVRFDLFEDFVQVLSRSTGYVKSKGDEFFFRSFPWTIGFNPREETPKSVVWISFPDLPANFFAKKSLMSIASAVGKPLAVDKATQDRTRPSTARVKVLLDLLAKHPMRVRINIVDKNSGKLVEHYQEIVYDNLPKYCTCCNHQGHDVKSCRWRMEKTNEEVASVVEIEGLGSIEKLEGDAREFLNTKRAEQLVDEAAKMKVVEQQLLLTDFEKQVGSKDVNGQANVMKAVTGALKDATDHAKQTVNVEAKFPNAQAEREQGFEQGSLAQVNTVVPVTPVGKAVVKGAEGFDQFGTAAMLKKHVDIDAVNGAAAVPAATALAIHKSVTTDNAILSRDPVPDRAAAGATKGPGDRQRFDEVGHRTPSAHVLTTGVITPSVAAFDHEQILTPTGMASAHGGSLQQDIQKATSVATSAMASRTTAANGSANVGATAMQANATAGVGLDITGFKREATPRTSHPKTPQSVQQKQKSEVSDAPVNGSNRMMPRSKAWADRAEYEEEEHWENSVDEELDDSIEQQSGQQQRRSQEASYAHDHSPGMQQQRARTQCDALLHPNAGQKQHFPTSFMTGQQKQTTGSLQIETSTVVTSSKAKAANKKSGRQKQQIVNTPTAICDRHEAAPNPGQQQLIENSPQSVIQVPKDGQQHKDRVWLDAMQQRNGTNVPEANSIVVLDANQSGQQQLDPNNSPVIHTYGQKATTMSKLASTSTYAGQQQLIPADSGHRQVTAPTSGQKQIATTSQVMSDDERIYLESMLSANAPQSVNLGIHLNLAREDDPIFALSRQQDVSPSRIGPNHNIRIRDKSWEGKVSDEGIVRRPPMRVAKQKQDASTTSTRSNRSKRK